MPIQSIYSLRSRLIPPLHEVYVFEPCRWVNLQVKLEVLGSMEPPIRQGILSLHLVADTDCVAAVKILKTNLELT